MAQCHQTLFLAIKICALVKPIPVCLYMMHDILIPAANFIKI